MLAGVPWERLFSWTGCKFLTTALKPAAWRLLEHRVLSEKISFSIWDEECPPAMRTFVVSVVARSFRCPREREGWAWANNCIVLYYIVRPVIYCNCIVLNG